MQGTALGGNSNLSGRRRFVENCRLKLRPSTTQFSRTSRDRCLEEFDARVLGSPNQRSDLLNTCTYIWLHDHPFTKETCTELDALFTGLVAIYLGDRSTGWSSYRICSRSMPASHTWQQGGGSPPILMARQTSQFLLIGLRSINHR